MVVKLRLWRRHRKKNKNKIRNIHLTQYVPKGQNYRIITVESVILPSLCFIKIFKSSKNKVVKILWCCRPENYPTREIINYSRLTLANSDFLHRDVTQTLKCEPQIRPLESVQTYLSDYYSLAGSQERLVVENIPNSLRHIRLVGNNAQQGLFR